MIIQAILDLLKTVLFTVFGWINLPNLPEELLAAIDTFFDLIFTNASIVGFFIRPTTLLILLPVLVIILNFEKVYKLTMWILKKIPMLNMK